MNARNTACGYFKIAGGTPLSGKVAVSGNKNAALPMLAAALLTDQPVIIDNLPAIGDVEIMLQLAEMLGAEVERQPRRAVITARDVGDADIPRSLSSQLRAGVLFAAPLLHRSGRVSMPPPGGDVIGKRRLDSHFHGLSSMGVEIEIDGCFRFNAARRLRGADIFLTEASVTATEHLMLAAVLAEGETIIRNAACEPHVQALGEMLVAMGAVIEGNGSPNLRITGVEKLNGTHCRVVSDHTEAGSFIALGAATGGDVTVTDINPEHYRMIAHVFRRLGIELQFGTDWVRVGPEQERRIQPDFTGGIPVIDDGIWPQFPSDLMSVCIVLATQVSGTVLFFEKLYESRMYFVDRLIVMGANAVICDPHRVVVAGPSTLHPIELSSPDIRAGIALLGAALCAKGQSIIRNVHFIDRGYEGIEQKLIQLGADIERKEG